MPPDVGLAVEVFSEAAPPPRTSGASKYDGPGCGLYGQFADICDWLKSARSRNARQGKVNGIATRETLAHRVNENLNKLKQIFARDWATLGADKQQIAVDLVVAAYCRSRGKPDDMCEEIRCKLLVVAIDTAWKAHVAPTSESRSKDVVRFFEDLQRLYRAPLTPDELCKVHTLRGQSQPRQPVLMSIGANLGAVNARRKVRLEQVSDALAQLDQLTPIHSQRHRLRPAVELHFALFSLEQQISLVQSVRAFLFAACEQRARKGTLPDPTDLIARIHDDIRKTLDPSWPLAGWRRFNACIGSLSAIVQFYSDHRARDSVVARFRKLLAPTEQERWSQLFLALEEHQQALVEAHCRNILRDLRSYWMQHEQLVDPANMERELLAVIPDAHIQRRLVEHEHLVQAPPAYSLSHKRSSLRTPSRLFLSHGHSPSPYFPRSRGG